MRYRAMLYAEPVPKARPRMTKSGHTYTPKRTRDYETYVANEWIRQNGKTLMKGDIKLELVFGMKIPKSWSKEKEKKAILGYINPATRPDTTNLIKAVEDGLNGVAYEDDKQIIDIRARKIYTPQPYTEIIIYEVTDGE